MADETLPLPIANLFRNLGDGTGPEQITRLVDRPGVRVERIVSHGHSTPEDQPYDQREDELVFLIRGAARLWIEHQGEIALVAGDYLLIPAHRRHRVVWTTPDGPTVWLAVHIDPRLSALATG